MSAKTEKLLSLYRTYENLVRDAGQDPKELEQSMDVLESNEMTMIRQFRNFLSHNQDPGFLEPTDRMLSVLERRVSDWTMRGDVAKKHLRTPAAAVCAEKDTCADGIEKLCRTKSLSLVVTGAKPGEYWICRLHAIAAAVAASKSAKLSSVPRSKEKPVFVRPDVLVSTLDRSRVNVCTADGTPQGKLLGVVKL